MDVSCTGRAAFESYFLILQFWELHGSIWYFRFSVCHGAAFPFSIGGKIEKGESTWRIMWECLLRGMRLTFFAIFIQHMYPWVTSSPQDATAWLLSIGVFFNVSYVYEDSFEDTVLDAGTDRAFVVWSSNLSFAVCLLCG